MTKNKKVIIGIIVAIIIVAFAYLQFGNPSFEDNGSLLTDAPSGFNVSATGSAEVIQSEAFFLQQIEQLRQVSIGNTEVIQGQGFQKLSDNTVILKEFKSGRSNPYQPIDARVQLRENLEAEAGRAAAIEAQNETPVFNISDDLLRQSQNNQVQPVAEPETQIQP